MANCPALKNILKDDCLNNTGGLKLKALVFPSELRAEYDVDVSGETLESILYTDDGTTGGLTGVTGTIISFHKNTGTLAESLASDAAIANTTNTITVAITVNNRSYAKSSAISIMAAGGREIDLFITQNNGTIWFIPDATLSVESTVGATRAEGSNYVLTFTSEQAQLVYGVEPTDFADLEANGFF